jgi:hypothetical protein
MTTALRILTAGDTDDVWLDSSSTVDLSTATATVRTFPADALPTGAWVAATDFQHPTANSVRTAMRVTDAVEGAYVMQVKLVIGPLTIIESGYYWVARL